MMAVGRVLEPPFVPTCRAVFPHQPRCPAPVNNQNIILQFLHPERANP